MSILRWKRKDLRGCRRIHWFLPLTSRCHFWGCNYIDFHSWYVTMFFSTRFYSWLSSFHSVHSIARPVWIRFTRSRDEENFLNWNNEWNYKWKRVLRLLRSFITELRCLLLRKTKHVWGKWWCVLKLYIYIRYFTYIVLFL